TPRAGGRSGCTRGDRPPSRAASPGRVPLPTTARRGHPAGLPATAGAARGRRLTPRACGVTTDIPGSVPRRPGLAGSASDPEKAGSLTRFGPTGRDRDVGLRELGQCPADAVDHLLPLPLDTLSEEAHRRVPGRVFAIQHPAPIRIGAKQRPGGYPER